MNFTKCHFILWFKIIVSAIGGLISLGDCRMRVITEEMYLSNLCDCGSDTLSLLICIASLLSGVSQLNNLPREFFREERC